ncbi:MAG: phenylalanine--tRNA ligase subunit beta [Firmicutes bacterium]|nr:phenylalanine--tRNA ligase subunit beta [Bacillota bacterium]
MKLSLNWLKEFVDLSGITEQEILNELSMKTAEVEGFKQHAHNLANVVVGQIITSRPHPSSKKPLNILTVDNGEAIVPVVCGCPTSSKVGMRVAFSKVGATLPNGFKVGEAMLAGEPSHGMCLSPDELGISSNGDPIFDLDTDLPNGTAITVLMPDLVDTVFEIDNKSLTNRPDLWGHYGFARELGVIFNRKLKPLPITNLDKYNELPPVSVKIESDQCYSFGAFKVENITTKISPISMKTRLFYCDINSHGFLVDLSNYIMLELGQPNHAFDAGKIGKLSAGHVNGGTFTTLKNQTFDIKPNHLFIKSDGVPVSLAGIMGGANSLICESTKDVVFEFATFNAGNIRKTSTELGIRSDSSTRYEKSLDTHLNTLGAARAIRLLTQYDKKAQVASNFNWQVTQPTTGKQITLSKATLERYAGISFDYKIVKKNLASLGFSPVITKTDIVVTVPSWRATKDITLPVDIIEEIVRIHGYDKILPTPPTVAINPIQTSLVKKREDAIKNLLVDKYALNEVHTYIWNDARALKDLKIQTPSYLKITNSVAQGCDDIRSEIIPSLINVVSKNKNQDNIKIFEIGKVFAKDEKEYKYLGIILASKTNPKEELYTQLSNLIKDLLGILCYDTKFNLGEVKQQYIHPKNNADIKINETTVGKIGIIHPAVMAAIDPKLDAVATWIRLERMPETSNMGITQKPSKFPKTTLDFTITISSIYGDLEFALDKFSHLLSFGYHLKDIYKREDGTTSYTIQFTVGSYEKTLTSEEIQVVWQAIVDHLKLNNFPVDNT